MVQSKHLTEMSTEEKIKWYSPKTYIPIENNPTEVIFCFKGESYYGYFEAIAGSNMFSTPNGVCRHIEEVDLWAYFPNPIKSAQVEPSTEQSVLSAEEYLKESRKGLPLPEQIFRDHAINLMESFANLRVQQEREKWKRENSDFVKRFNLIADICDLSILVNIK